MRRWWIVPGVLLCIALAAAGFSRLGRRSGSPAATSYRTAPVTRGDLSTRISATGTLEPEEVIDVGAQIAGRVIAFGNDVTSKPIDYGSVVRQDDLLARLDDAIYRTEATQARAQLEQARAGLVKAQADVRQMQAKAMQAKREWDRAQGLSAQFESQSDLDTALSNHEVAQASLEVASASVVQARAEIAHAEASVERANRNLEYCTISSPVSGVVIDRRVNIGQTVVASLNAPSLFLIAKDLRRMQVWISVNEADIGSIKAGQQVTFTVDAFPGREFRGRVGKVRLNASMSQNVVTYTVEVVTDNPDNTLIPYLTANVQFHIDERHGVLRVPNAALRWAPEDQAAAAGGSQGSPGREMPTDDMTATQGTVWVQDGGQPRPLQVRTGITDGTMTEVESGKLRDGMEVIVGEQEAGQAAAETGTSNPFLPKMPARGKSGGGPPPPP